MFHGSNVRSFKGDWDEVLGVASALVSRIGVPGLCWEAKKLHFFVVNLAMTHELKVPVRTGVQAGGFKRTLE